MKNAVSKVHVTLHKDGKLEGFSSISTSSKSNQFCKDMHKVKNAVCEKCYTDLYLSYRGSLRLSLESNYEYLTTHEMTEQEATAVPIHTLVCRLESFGEAANIIHARNLVLIAKTHPLTTFAVWTKRAFLYEKVFDEIGKPDNLTFVVSSPLLNIQNGSSPSADHVFTVYTKDGENINCEKKCHSCMKCYRKGEPFFINELLK